MARPIEELNHENIATIIGLYQMIVAEGRFVWETGKRALNKYGRPSRGRMSAMIAGYRVTVFCEIESVSNSNTTIRVSAPGWTIHLKGVPFVGRAGQVHHRVYRVGEKFSTSLSFIEAKVQGLNRFKHQMTLISMFADVSSFRDNSDSYPTAY